MQVLIIGGTQFVGYLLAWRLLAAGHRVTLLNRGTRPDPFGERVARLTCDRTTAEFDRAVGESTWDACVDLAGYRAEDTAGAVRALGGRVGHYVYISSGQVYLVREGASWPAKESDYAGPIMPYPDAAHDRADWEYGVGKREAEDVLARAWQEQQFPSTRLRIPMVNGERDYYRRIDSYLWRLLDGGPLLLPDGGQVLCRHVYGLEVVRAITGILGNERTFGEAYNLCQEEQPTLKELIGMLADLLGARACVMPISGERLAEAGLRPIQISPFSDAWMSRLDPSRAAAELGFRHRPLAEYLPAIVAHFLASLPPDRPVNYIHRPLELQLAAGL
jgi:nucleoside-diphosphate-sugar epimerase